MDFVKKEKGEEEANIRQRIMKAAFEVMGQDGAIPDPENLAKKAGLTVEVVSACYPSIADLATDIGIVTEASYQPLYEAMPEPGSLADMLDELVELRAHVYETVAPTRLYGDGAEHFVPGARENKAVREGRYRGALTDMLTPYFGSRTDAVASQVELLTSWESWKHLRFVQCLTEEQTKDTLRKLVRAFASS